jgi:RNA polymerase sigma factor (sigma-70 family)
MSGQTVSRHGADDRRQAGVEADNAVAQATAAPPEKSRMHPPDEFFAFFREHHTSLIRTAMYAGATRQEARLAAQDAMTDVLKRWTDIGNPLAYARKAVLSCLFKARRDGLDRVRVKQVRLGAGTPEVRPDQNLTTWEDRQWVRQLLDSLPPKQREVMALVVDGFEPSEIAALLGRSPEAVRQNLCEARTRLKQTLVKDQVTHQVAESMRKES